MTKIRYVITESERGNPVVRLEIQHPTYIETLWGWKGYERLKQLDNIISEKEIREYRLNVELTDALYKEKK